ncbi:MAG: class I SAM-dependent methyltransferase [Vicingaceae bacterium]
MLQQVFAYLHYLIKSIHLHGIHSPFVFQLEQEIINEKLPYYAFDEIETIRAKLLLTQKKIKINDLGAGSKRGKSDFKTIRQITKQSAKSPKHAQLLFRLAYHFKPKTILELGTSFGISTAYLAKACPESKIISIEGSHEIAKVAEVNLEKLNVHNVKQIIGNFDSELTAAAQELKQLDFVFFDGNHRKTPTLSYFKECLELANEGSIFVFDDIHWSTEMESAWKAIKAHPKVRQSIDLFEVGLVFFKEDQAEEHFTVYH